MRAVLERLPEEVRSSFSPEVTRRAIAFGSHYPDSFDPFSPADLGESAVASLLAAGLKVRFDLHLEHGRVASFAALVEAFREENPAHIAHWIASHSHVIADMAACNHDPLVHTATYGWGFWKVKLPHGNDFSKVVPLLDLSGSARDEAGGSAAFARAIDRFHIEDDGRDRAEQIHEILLYDQEGARFCSSRGSDILRGSVLWADSRDEAGRKLLWERIGELGAWAVVRTLRDVSVARRFAKENRPVQLTAKDEEAARISVETLLRERLVEEDSLFSPILRPLRSGDRGLIGVVIEPTWDMNDAMLGFSSRVQATAIVRTLSKQHRPHATLDLRELLSGGFPDPSAVPLLVITATSCHNYYWMNVRDLDAGLSTYLGKGGKVLWIMGTGPLPEAAFAPLRAALRRTEANSLPIPVVDFVKATLTAHFPGTPSWRMANTPETPAGWQKPLCPWWFDESTCPDLEPLLTLSCRPAPLIVGVTTADHRLTVLPIYAVTPHLLDASTPPPSPFEPELDAPATTILLGTLQHILR